MVGSLRYYGAAATGRFSGETKLNLQSLPKKPYPDPDKFQEEIFRVDIRSFIKAPKGKKLIIADYSQIEPRILAWLTGNESFLKVVSSGVSPYEAHARDTMGWVSGVLKEESPKTYALAKARVLGLGFGCGWKKFISVAKAMAGLVISPAESKQCVDDFRNSNPAIVGLWKTLDTAFKKHCAWNSFTGRNDPFTIELPSGRQLYYFNPEHIAGKGRALRSRDSVKWSNVYGGLLVENLVQATARDILGEALIRLTRDGYRVLFHVHDEVIIEADMDEPLGPVEKLLCVVPNWISGLPLGVTIEEAEHYKK